MSPKKKSNKKPKSTETGQPANVTSLSDSILYFGFSHLAERSKIINAVIDAGFSNKEVTMAYNKFQNEGKITEDADFTASKLICFLKVVPFSQLESRTKGKQSRLKLRRSQSMKAVPPKKSSFAFLISPLSLLSSAN